MARVMNRKKSKSKRKMPRPISDSPGKRLGISERVSAMPLVERVTAYQAKVKWCRRVCHGRGGWRTVGIRVRLLLLLLLLLLLGFVGLLVVMGLVLVLELAFVGLVLGLVLVLVRLVRVVRVLVVAVVRT